jgi:hypothetical protein
MKGVPVKTAMSLLECAIWAAEFARARGGNNTHAAVGAAIDCADQTVINLRTAYGSDHGPLTMSGFSPLEAATWAAEFARVHAEDNSSPAAVRAAIDGAAQAVIDLRDALGTEHSSLAMRELRDDPDAALAVLKARLLREKDKR